MILVTGVNGQVGWELARRGAAQSVRGFTHAELDIADAGKVDDAVESLRPKVVINAAAYTAVDKAEGEREKAFLVNELGPRNLARACAARDVPLIHISTDYVFDGAKPAPYVETDPVAPLGVYGASKLAGERAVLEAGAKAVILRTAWVFGAHGGNFVKTMLRLGAERDALRIVSDQKGCPTAAGDLADAILKIAARLPGTDDADRFGIFHCVGAGPTTWFDFARAIFDIARPARIPALTPITTAEYPTPARRPANSVLECGKLASTHGITLRNWAPALTEMLAEIRS
ncbi:MAG: dTDP-4-dehydrorhamnose reductase [Rhodospirillaceae bacterium]|nr:dTDP-4-dehydrorhamnose reductase [Rhodospirillaceae bacterium]